MPESGIKEDIDFKKILQANSELGQIQDIDILLERILAVARSIVNADAGSIYIKQSVVEADGKTDMLYIRHAQNDTRQKLLPPGEKQTYPLFSVPIDKLSIAGYCAHMGRIINIQDMYHIPEDAPYSFNSSFDQRTGYRTVSSLTFPIAADARLLGVIQLLNKTDRTGNIVPFSEEDELVLRNFAISATHAMERAYITRAMIIRMIRMAELRDPAETGSHVNRVASYSVELYDRWAHKHNVPERERTVFRDNLRIGAMLHDIGKVAISDAILKKPGRLTEDEFLQMQEHTIHGASLFRDSLSEVDSLAMEIALTHHENWDGTGYPGWIDPTSGLTVRQDEEGKPVGKKGEEIPLAGRIVAVADVFDALCSKRAYKEAWTEEQVLAQMRELSGKRFDPEFVDIFFEVLPMIKHSRQLHSQNLAA